MDLSAPLPEPDRLAGVPLDADGVALVHAWLVSAPAGETSWETVRSLEELKNAVTARQAQLTVALHDQQLAADTAGGLVKPGHTDRVVAGQLGIARRCSPAVASRWLRAAQLAVSSGPVGEAMLTGVIGQEQAALLVRETDGLTDVDRDRVIGQVAGLLGQVSDPHLRDEVRTGAHRVDPDLAGRRARLARQARRVQLRAARDGAAYLSAFLPAVEAQSCFEALRVAGNQAAAAEPTAGTDSTSTGAGDRRTARQWMADLLVARVTGRDPVTAPVPVRVNVLIPIDALCGDGDEPAYLPGYGPLPAADTAALLAENPVIRRLFTRPGTGELVGMDTRSRRYRGLLGQLVRWRDRRCRTPFCGAWIADIDHITPHAAGGASSARNGQGVCSRCNQTKEHPAWSVTGDGSHTITRTGGLVAQTRPPAATRPRSRAFWQEPEWQQASRRARRAGAALGAKLAANRARPGPPRPPTTTRHPLRRAQFSLPETGDDPPS